MLLLLLLAISITDAKSSIEEDLRSRDEFKASRSCTVVVVVPIDREPNEPCRCCCCNDEEEEEGDPKIDLRLFCEADKLGRDEHESDLCCAKESGFCPVAFQYLENTDLRDEILIVLPKVETEESSSSATVVSAVNESRGGKLS